MRRFADCLPLFALGVPSLCMSTVVSAAFFEDSTVALTTRNYYLDRDYKGDSSVSAVREWAQGFIIKANSGYTDGPVGLGLDLTGMLGVKLDSSPERSGTQLLPIDPQTRRAQDAYSELGVAVKARFSQTNLSVGTQLPALPVITARPARLLPQTFRGSSITSLEVEHLSLQAGRMARLNVWEWTNNRHIALDSPYRRFPAGCHAREGAGTVPHDVDFTCSNFYTKVWDSAAYQLQSGRDFLENATVDQVDLIEELRAWFP